MRQAILTLLQYGLNVIADEVFWKREWLLRAATTFADNNAYLIGVFVSDFRS